MEFLRTFLEQQPLLSMFLVIGLGYAVGQVNIRASTWASVRCISLASEWACWRPRRRPPALLGSFGLVMFVYGIGIQYGKQFFAGLTSPFWPQGERIGRKD